MVAERQPALPIPIATRTKARNLYLLQQLPAQEIADACGLRRQQVYDLASNEGWTKKRKQMLLRATESSDARADRMTQEVQEALACDTEELSFGTVDKCKKTLLRDDRDAARDLQAYSQSLKNFVGVARQTRGLDNAKDAGNTTNVLFVSCPRAGDSVPVKAPSKAEPINVTPAKPTDA
jgi:hypothetical protein